MFAGVMTHAWIAGTIVGALAGAVGFFVVLRGASFAAHTLPLGAFPGAAAASLLGINPYVGIFACCGLGAIALHALARRERPEIATALCLVMLLGLGALFLSMTRQYAQSVFALLFGALLGISGADIGALAATAAVVTLAIAVAFRPLLLSSVAPDLAEARGVPGGAAGLVFLAVLALASAVAMPAVGALLVFSLMVGPAAAARGFAAAPATALLLSMALALVTVWGAIALSYLTDWPVGFFVGVGSAALFGTERASAAVRRLLSP